jgi:hypothetical protein
MPEEGEKVNRLVDIAKEKNIDYKPSQESITVSSLLTSVGLNHVS